MPRRRSSQSGPPVQLTVRIAPALHQRLGEYVEVTGRTYRDLTETAIGRYLDGLQLTAEQKDALKKVTKGRG